MNFRNVFVAISLVLSSFAASAGCNGLSPIVPGQGYQTGGPCWAGNQQVGQVVTVVATQPQVVQYIQQERRIPPNCRIVEKSFWDRLTGGAKEAALDGIVGALGGAATDGIRRTGGRWTNIGLNGGAALGFAEGSADKLTMICQNQADERQPERPQTKRIPANCEVGGKSFGDISEEECLKKRDALTVKVSGTPTLRTYGKTPTSSSGHTCAVLDQNGNVIADFLDSAKNPKEVVVTTGQQCQEEQAQFKRTIAQR